MNKEYFTLNFAEPSGNLKLEFLYLINLISLFTKPIETSLSREDILCCRSASLLYKSFRRYKSWEKNKKHSKR